MSDYVLSCCSTADLTQQHFDARNISIICFHFFLDGKEYVDDLGASVPFEQFYQRMSQGADTRTSQVNVAEFLDYFNSFLAQGRDVLHISLSSGLSGAYNSATAAAALAMEQYPDRRVLVVDSLAASSGYGLLMDRLADLRDQGQSLEQLYQWTLDNRLLLHHWFFSTDLTWYVKGGRISKAAGAFGMALRICPLLNMDQQGHLIPRAKIRTKKKVIQEIVARMEEQARDGLAYDGKCYISNSACYEDAQAVAELIEQRFPQLDGRVEINHVGTTIGAHTGPGTVALFFWGQPRQD